MTQQARIYQLTHGHAFTGLLTAQDGVKTAFRYGIKATQRLAKTTYQHGLTGSQTEYEIETVDSVIPKVGEYIEMSHNGKRTTVAFVETAILDEAQLRFVSYEKADKIVTIGVRNLGD